MRDPKRIDRIIDALREKWKKYPDLRLGQLIVNAGLLVDKHATDTYYIEDDLLERGIKAYLSLGWRDGRAR